jgi:transposase
MGRSKGGLSTKIHAVVDALGNPVSFHLTSGQACDLDGADKLLPDLAADTVLADKGYDADERVIEPLRAQGKTVVIPPRRNRKHLREYDKELYKARHLIENFFAKLKQYRAIATRYDKRAANFLGAIYLAASVIWLNWWHALELIQTICVYKFPELTRQEIEKMLNLDALKETRVYQEAKEEGQQSEKRATIERLLALPLGVEQIVQAVALPIEDVARIIEQIQNWFFQI